VLYTLESLGRVDLPNRAAPLDALQGQVVATQRAILTFQLWTILETDDYDELLYRDLVFELEGR